MPLPHLTRRARSPPGGAIRWQLLGGHVLASRMLLIALDALDVSLFRLAMAEGRIPNLTSFVGGGVEAEVHSAGEELEGSVWPSFASGLSAGSHGRHWNIQWFAEDNGFVLADDPRLAFEPFWKAALEAGKRVTVMDLPYAPTIGHPLEQTYNGWGVQDEMAEHAYPPSFRRQILKQHGRSLTRKDTLLVRTPEDRARLARRSKASSRQRTRLLQGLVEKRDWDLLIFGYGEMHRAGHHLAAPMDFGQGATNDTAMMNLLQPIDEAWPRIVAAAGEDCHIGIFALHGMHPRVSYGHLTMPILARLWGRPAPAPPPRDALRRIRDLLPQSVHEEIWLRLPANYRSSRIARAWRHRMDLQRDPAFMLEADCAVAYRLNVAGRERDGVVPPGEERTAAEEIWAELRRYRTPEGLPAFDALKMTSDRFHGPRLHRLPDFTVTYAPEVRQVTALVRDDGFTIENTAPVSRNGVHTDRGFLYFRPAGAATLRRDQLQTEDFAPTVLDLAGVTPPAGLEGESVAG
jgi:predicted AlkP superfamily phosphohydrolase/phosphomutase